MNSRKFLVQIIFACCVLIAANLAIHQLAMRSVPRQILSRALELPPATHLFFGNSLMEAGLNEHIFAAGVPLSQPFNVGLGSSSPVEHFVLYKQLKKHRLATVYYGFFDLQLTDVPSGDVRTLAGNRAFALYADIESSIRFYAPNSLWKALTLRFAAQIPAVVERLAIWSKVERIRRTLGEIGMPKVSTNQFGNVDDFALLEAAPDEMESRCHTAVENQIPLCPPLRELIKEVVKHGTVVRFIEMPLPSQHRDRFYSSRQWKQYREYLIQLTHDLGCDYIPASDWVDDDGFSDSLHLNPSGAAIFSSKLASYETNRQIDLVVTGREKLFLSNLKTNEHANRLQ